MLRIKILPCLAYFTKFFHSNFHMNLHRLWATFKSPPEHRNIKMVKKILEKGHPFIFWNLDRRYMLHNVFCVAYFFPFISASRIIVILVLSYLHQTTKASVNLPNLTHCFVLTSRKALQPRMGGARASIKRNKFARKSTPSHHPRNQPSPNSELQFHTPAAEPRRPRRN